MDDQTLTCPHCQQPIPLPPQGTATYVTCPNDSCAHDVFIPSTPSAGPKKGNRLTKPSVIFIVIGILLSLLGMAMGRGPLGESRGFLFIIVAFLLVAASTLCLIFILLDYCFFVRPSNLGTLLPRRGSTTYGIIVLWGAGLVLTLTNYVTGHNHNLEMRNRLACWNNLDNIGSMLKSYCINHHDDCPPTLEMLADGYMLAHGTFHCPGKNGESSLGVCLNSGELVTDYDYYGAGLNRNGIKDPEDVIVVADHKGNHPDGGVIGFLFLDGHVGLFRCDDVANAIAKNSEWKLASDLVK